MPISNVSIISAPLVRNNPRHLTLVNRILLCKLSLGDATISVDAPYVVNIFRTKLRGVMRNTAWDCLRTEMRPMLRTAWARCLKPFRKCLSKRLATTRLAALRNHISHVVFMGSEKEVERVYAPRRIALVEYELIDGTYTIPKEVSHPMGANGPTSDRELSVAAFCSSALPQPALGTVHQSKTPKLLRLLWRNGSDGTISDSHGMNLVDRFASWSGSFTASTVRGPFVFYHGGTQCLL